MKISVHGASMKGTRLLALVGTIACAVGCASSSDASGELRGQQLEYEIGAVYFDPGDDIELVSVTSDTGSFEAGALLTVEGTYRLESEPTALLLLSITGGNEGKGPTTIHPDQNRKLVRGAGSFVLSTEYPGTGYPHVTFYRDSGGAMGGVYFGSGDSLLLEKW